MGNDYKDISISRNAFDVVINNKTYTVRLFSPLSDFEDMEILSDEDGRSDFLIRKQVCNHILHADKEINPQDISDDVVNEYIDACLSSFPALQSEFHECEKIKDKNERFVVAQKRVCANEQKILFEQIKKHDFNSIQAIGKTISDAFSSYGMDDSLWGIGATLLKFSRGVKNIIGSHLTVENISESLRIFSETEYRFAQQLAERFADVRARFTQQIIENEQHEKCCNSMIEWGNLGWTIYPDSSMTDYYIPPENKEDADKRVRSFCNTKGMEYLFSELRSIKGIKKSDLNEAIQNYKEKRYKSCALVLFAIIDAKMIRQMTDEDRKPVGLGAAKKIEERLKTKFKADSSLTLYYLYLNTTSCLKKLFEYARNFRDQPDVINRNFLDHGMLHRKVSKRDCNQLFLLLYNYSMILSYIPR